MLFNEFRVLVVHLAATGALMGLIWTIQLVHYPLFPLVDQVEFVAFEQRHSFRVSLIVGPLMAAELLSALWIAWRLPFGIAPATAWAALFVLGIVHGCTVLFSVPAHQRLGRGFDSATHKRLLLTNWIRTAGWTVRTLLAMWMVVAAAEVRFAAG